MSKVTTEERLAIASAVAPILRSVPDLVTKRRVKVYSRETGETLREAEYGDALRGLAEVYALEHAIDEAQAHEAAKRGTMRSSCKQCGLEFEYPYDGGIRSACDRCRATPCGGECGKLPPKSAFSGYMIRKRNGQPWLCKSCAMRQALNKPATKEKLRLRKHRKRVSPDVWAKTVEKLKETWSDPGLRARNSARSRELARDPDWLSKTAEASARGIAAKATAGK